MLVQVYKCGASRQQIKKGFNVYHQNLKSSKELAKKIAEEFNDTHIKLIYNPRKKPNTIWFDTGMVWFHNAKSRELNFSRLNRAINNVALKVFNAQGLLLPSAVRANVKDNWDNYVCGDAHFLETLSDVEKEVFCNLCRQYEPLLIALSGRAGVDSRGIENVGSRRLLDSQSHFTSRYLASLEASHLEKVKKVLNRDDGVSKLEVLGVNPLGNQNIQNIPSVEIRFNDGQAMLSNTRAQAIFYQAILLKARKLVREGRRVGNIKQRLIENNRAKTIANGLNATLEEDPFKVNPQNYKRRKEQSGAKKKEQRKKYILASKSLALTLEEFTKEFMILEVEYHEIASLILGVSLKQLGLPGICNENDLFKVLSSKKGWDIEWPYIIQSLYQDKNPQEKAYQSDRITKLNEERFPKQSELTKRWWMMKLKYRSTPKNQHDNIKQGKEKNQREAHRFNRKERDQRLKEGVQELKHKLHSLNVPADIPNILNAFIKKTGNNRLSYALKTLNRDEAKIIRRKLVPENDFRFRIKDRDKGWENIVIQRGLKSLDSTPFSMLSYTSEQKEEKAIQTWLTRLTRSVPKDVLILILGYSSFNNRKTNKRLLNIEILLTKKI